MKYRTRISLLSLAAVASLVIGVTSVLASSMPSSTVDPIMQENTPTETMTPTASLEATLTETPMPSATLSSTHETEKDEPAEKIEPTEGVKNTPVAGGDELNEVEIHHTPSAVILPTKKSESLEHRVVKPTMISPEVLTKVLEKRDSHTGNGESKGSNQDKNNGNGSGHPDKGGDKHQGD